MLALGPERSLSPAVWSSLSALDRFALAKVVDRGRADRIAAAYAEIVGDSAISTHLSPRGGVRMVDVSEKPLTLRSAVAESAVRMNAEAFTRLSRSDAPKGDVLGTARLAGIMAAKRTSELVPLCHPVALTHLAVELALDEGARVVRITATAEAYDRTGVEMEALVAASAAALTVYDMLKAFDRGIEIGPTRLRSKSGGRSGDYER
jgi:cyclic pyranopterin phosphate synthase